MREDMKTRAAERTVMIPDIAMPAVRRLVDRGTPGREQSEGRRYSRLINALNHAEPHILAAPEPRPS